MAKTNTRESKIAAARKAFTDGKMTPARAAKLRAMGASLCGCQLCEWALSPPLTMAEHAHRMGITVMLNTSGAWGPHKSWADILSAAVESARPPLRLVPAPDPSEVPDADPRDVQEVDDVTEPNFVLPTGGAQAIAF